MDDLDDLLSTDRYPLDPDDPAWSGVVAKVRQDLAERGCSVLHEFVRPDRLEALRAECAGVVPLAYYDVQTVNVYNSSPAAELPDGHPGRVTMERGNAFVARDDIPDSLWIHRLYTDPRFAAFLAACFGVPRIFPLADPLAGLCVNVVPPGKEHPWHFDTNEYAVSMVTQAPEAGGVFEYCPAIRSTTDEHLDDVAGVLAGDTTLVRRLELRPGDLQIFRGRYSLHRVSRVDGSSGRHSAIFSYSERPDVVGSPVRTRQLFGRLTPAHQRSRARVDQLLD